jgi:hypothetical protein
LHSSELLNSEAPTHQYMLHGMIHLITCSWLKTHQIFKFNIYTFYYFIISWIQLSKSENSNSLTSPSFISLAILSKNCRHTTVKNKASPFPGSVFLQLCPFSYCVNHEWKFLYLDFTSNPAKQHVPPPEKHWLRREEHLVSFMTSLW